MQLVSDRTLMGIVGSNTVRIMILCLLSCPM